MESRVRGLFCVGDESRDPSQREFEVGPSVWQVIDTVWVFSGQDI